MRQSIARLSNRLSILDKGIRPRRALFNVPGCDAKKLAKAATINADSIVYDLEDGVPINQKGAARSLVVKALEEQKLQAFSEKAVRINAIGSGLELDDLNVVLSCRNLQTLVIPKVESRDHLMFVERIIQNIATSSVKESVKLIACIESALGVLNLRDIASALPGRLEALVFSSEDYCADTGIIRTDALREMTYARSSLVNAAAANRLQAIDLVCIDYKNMDKLEAECTEGRQFGFTGKQAIHPGQVSKINEVFSPSPEQIAKAKHIIAEYERHIQKGIGAFVIDNKMVDIPVVKWANNIVKNAEMLSIC